MSQLEKAREATDAANLRAAYAEVMTQAVSGETVTPKAVTITQQTEGWAYVTDKVGDIAINTIPSKGTVTVDFDKTNNTVTFK